MQWLISAHPSQWPDQSKLQNFAGFQLRHGDSGIFASLYDAIEPRARGTAAGLMNTVGWGGGALGPLFVGWVTQHGRRPTPMENMSDAIAFGGVIYLAAAALIFLAIFFFTRPRETATSLPTR